MALNLITLTPAQSAAVQLQQLFNGISHQAANNATAVFNLLWKNPDQVNFPPNVMIASLGKNAAAVLGLISSFTTAINGIRGAGSFTLTIPAGWTLTMVGDGSATATHTP